MKKILFAVAMLSSSMAFAEVVINEPAPAFSEVDQAGKTVSLADNKGKWVVLEWYNEDCPFVKKHYSAKNMQKLQKNYTGKGVVWYTVATSAKGKQGYIDAKDAAQHYKTAGMTSTGLLLDSDGNMGKAYDAKTTPHMFVINPEGKVVYAGAIDSNDSADPKTISTSVNYVASALDEAMAGKPVTKSTSRPYGCGIKY